MKVIPALHSDLSPPLRDQPVVWPQTGEEREPHVHPKIPINTRCPDPVIQSSFWQPRMTSPTLPGPIPAVGRRGESDVGCHCAPPDTNGAVGKTQYVQMVNEGLQVFDKLTGTSLFGPVPITSFWSGFGGACDFHGNGDPVVSMISSLTGGLLASLPAGGDPATTSVSLFPRPAMPPERGTDTTFTLRTGSPIIPSSASGRMAITCPQLFLLPVAQLAWAAAFCV